MSILEIILSIITLILLIWIFTWKIRFETMAKEEILADFKKDIHNWNIGWSDTIGDYVASKIDDNLRRTIIEIVEQELTEHTNRIDKRLQEATVIQNTIDSEEYLDEIVRRITVKQIHK